MNERVTEFWRIFLATYKRIIPPPAICFARVWGVVVVVGSCGGTNSGSTNPILSIQIR